MQVKKNKGREELKEMKLSTTCHEPGANVQRR